MEVTVVDGEDLGKVAADTAARALGAVLDRREEAHLAVSGGSTPEPMFAALAASGLPWERIHVWQVDERVAPDGHEDRNLTSLEAALGEVAGTAHLHPMPVTDEDLTAAAASYAEELREHLGEEPRLDVVHLGIGSDGHTASLVPDDAVLGVDDRDVAITGEEYQGRLRMTLTYPALARARSLVWLVSGSSKAAALAQLVEGDESIPAGRVRRDDAIVLADRDAAV